MATNITPLHKSDHKGQDLLSLNRKVMLLAGIIPPQILSERATNKILFTLYLICCYGLFIPLFIGQILAVYHFWGNMDATTFSLLTLLGFSMTQLEGIYARLHSSYIYKLLEFLECDVNSRMKEMDMNKSYIHILEEAKVKARRLSITMIVMIDVTVACWIIFPFTRKYLREHNGEALNVTTLQYEDKWLDFCYVIWVPFDITVSPYYEITYVSQIIVFITAAACWRSVETTIMTLIIYTSAHLKILEGFLSEMKASFSNDSINGESSVQSNSKHLENNGRFTSRHSVKQLCTAESNQECVFMDRLENNGFKDEKQKLGDFITNFVNYHEAINEFMRKINKTFGPILFICFFIRQLLVCLQLFQMAVTDIDDTFVTSLAACISTMIPHFIFCWYGNEVIENIHLLKRVAFESSLGHQSREFKHLILMIMKIAQKPLWFSALGFYTLSLEDFAKTVNGAYAYFNILKNLHGDQ